MEFTIGRPNDFHVHLRDGAMLKLVAPLHNLFGYVLVMPNTPAIHRVDQARWYHREIMAAGATFTPLMVLKLSAELTQRELSLARATEIIGCKLYPKGATTASHDGIADPYKLGLVYEIMERKGLVLQVHAEDPNVADPWDREEAYIPVVEWISKRFPALRMVIEHVSTKAMVDFVTEAHANVAATITAHHLTMTRADLAGDGLRPHYYCCPILKTERDREALVHMALAGDPKFFFGSDSAPHSRQYKEQERGAAGCFAPGEVALPILAEFFVNEPRTDQRNKQVATFDRFVRANGEAFYRLESIPGKLTFTDERGEVPDSYTNDDHSIAVVPLYAYRSIGRQVTKTEDYRDAR